MSATSPYLLAYAVDAASRFTPSTDASILLRHHGANVRAASSSPGAARCDQVEARTDQGPCIEAVEKLGAVLVPEVAAEDRWPDWRVQATREGYASSLAMPAVVTQGVAVSLNLYSPEVDPWDGQALVGADACTQEIARAVGLRLQLSAAVARARPDEGWSSQDVVENAVALTTECNACTPDEARAILEGAARRRDLRLEAIAESIVRALRPDDVDRPDET